MVTKEEIDRYWAWRKRVEPLATSLGFDLDEAEASDRHQLIHALDVLVREQESARDRARALTSTRSSEAAPGTQVAAARRVLEDIRVAKSEHPLQSQHEVRAEDPYTRNDPTFTEAIARRLMGMQEPVDAEGSR